MIHSTMNRAGIILFAVATIFAGTIPQTSDAAPPATAPAARLTEKQSKAIEDVVQSLLNAGFPDTKGATAYRGKLAVLVTVDPTKQLPPLPTAESGMQESVPGSNEVKYGFNFEGLHFKLADGSWLIGMKYHFTPGKKDTFNLDDAQSIDLSTLSADAIKDSPFDAGTAAAKYLATISPATRDLSAAAMNLVVPISKYLQLGPDEFGPALILLHRAGWADSDTLAIPIADTRARSYWQLKPWTTPDGPFDPTGEYPTIKQEEADWKKAHTPFVPEAPEVAVRRAMFRVCRAQMMIPDPEATFLNLDVAAACTKAMVDPSDPQHNADRIDQLLAGAKLPVDLPENAKLMDRLASWETHPRMPKMIVGGGGQQANGTVTFSTGFSAPNAAYVPDKKDLDALVAELGDDKPSRFFDFTGDRSIGDNAWRALAQLLKSDPRTLAGYPTDHPWTAAERIASANAVQAWWKDHSAEYK